MLNERTLELARQILTPLLTETINYQEGPSERYNDFLYSAFLNEDGDIRQLSYYVIDFLYRSIPRFREGPLVNRLLEPSRWVRRDFISKVHRRRVVATVELLGQCNYHQRDERFAALRVHLLERFIDEVVRAPFDSAADDKTTRIIRDFAANPPTSPSAPGINPMPPFSAPGAPSQAMLIVIHGTGAAYETWWRWGSDFTAFLNSIAGTVYKGSDPFSWNGYLDELSRDVAATNLVGWIKAHPTNHLTVVAHSHGGNVALLASRRGAVINRLVLLGTPIDTKYTPNLVSSIDMLHNVYSHGDKIQIGGAWVGHRRGEGRTLPDSTKLLNHVATWASATLFDFNPGHSDLHEKQVWKDNQFDQLLL